jgi:hypothetical protein
MGEKIVVGPINKGLKLDRTPFVIDNDSFPTLINAYQWRGRVKRKRGTAFLSRLARVLTAMTEPNPDGTAVYSNDLLLTLHITEPGASIVPGTLLFYLDFGLGNQTLYQDDSLGNVTVTSGPFTISSGTINYATAVLTLNFTAVPGAGVPAQATFKYYPSLPVLGLEDLILIPTEFPGTLAFDNRYAYNQNTASPYFTYNVNYYKNLATGNYVGYIQKTIPTPLVWNGQDYQQFWSANYQGAFWVTNGINIPFSVTNVGMQFKPIVTTTVVAIGPPAIVTLQITGHGLVVGDFLFINEVVTTTGINFQTGYVISVGDPNNVNVEFPNATINGNGSGGIAQYLTNNSDATKDCIRFYDGDPTNGSASAPVLIPGNGWVNFMPPLSERIYVIADLPEAIYYLVTARMIVPFKDRLLFIGPVVQTSSGPPIYLQDTIIYSQNGTPYYTASYTNMPNALIDTPTSVQNVFTPILVPTNQTATSPAYFGDSAGFGGWISAGVAQPITTTSSNEDVLIIGFSTNKSQVVYSGNDIVPFNFFTINSEYGDASTFSSINMDHGVITRGSRGFITTSQRETSRIDLDIPDEVFEIKLTDNGNERFCAVRNFTAEWIYFTYPSNTSAYRFPSQTLIYNYRDNSWGIFKESYTTYGSFKRTTGYTWATVGDIYETWEEWNDPWDSNTTTILQQEVIAGNQQGFIVSRDKGTGESVSLYIQAFDGTNNIVTSIDHNLATGDYIIITGAIGDVAEFVNGEIFSVLVIDADTFKLNVDPLMGTASYLGGGLITRMYVPQIQTKQFPADWANGRKTRIGVQQYLFTTTAVSQITLLIFLSMNSASAYNQSLVVPDPGSVNDSLVYSNILFTCPESTNLGLTPANINLQMPTALQQSQIWHRMNTSLIGDTIQIGFTLSDIQMRDLEINGVVFVMTGVTTTNPAVISTTAAFQTGQLIEISGVVGMTQLNGNRYQVLSSTAIDVTINVNSSAFTAYVSGGTMTPVAGVNGFAEIEFHGMILDVTESSLLA